MCVCATACEQYILQLTKVVSFHLTSVERFSLVLLLGRRGSALVWWKPLMEQTNDLSSSNPTPLIHLPKRDLPPWNRKWQRISSSYSSCCSLLLQLLSQQFYKCQSLNLNHNICKFYIMIGGRYQRKFHHSNANIIEHWTFISLFQTLSNFNVECSALGLAWLVRWASTGQKKTWSHKEGSWTLHDRGLYKISLISLNVFEKF